MAVSAAGAAPPGPRSNWLHGAPTDLLLGAGLAYLLTIPLLVYCAAAYGMSAWSANATAGLALLVSGPHYGATLLRVYEKRTDRRKYVIFSFYVTLALVGLFGLGLESVLVGSLLVTAYVTWSPWHFAGQNYGISLMFLRRRGATVSPAFKRWFYLSFVLSAALAMISIHRAASQLVFAQGASNYRVYEVLRAGIPEEWGTALAVGVGGAYLASLVVAAVLLLRTGTLRDLLEPFLLVATQALWFALPALGAITGAYQMLGLAFAPIWISTGHAVQYLWVTSYYAKRSSPPVPTFRFLGRALLAGALLMVLPSLIFAPHVLGARLTNYADAAVLLFAVVNLHHFLLDGAVWKLRDGRVASVLLRTDGGASSDPAEAEGRGWLRPVVLGLGAACLAAAAYVSFALWLVRSPTMPLAEVDRANRVLAWLGRGDAFGCTQLAERHLNLGMIDHAIEDYRICLDVVGSQLEREPSALLTGRLASLLLGYQRENPASVAEARRLAGYAVRKEPENLAALELLAEAHLASGDPGRAEKTVEHAIVVARASGATERVALLERRREALARGASKQAWPER